jgi:hypothetical protein
MDHNFPTYAFHHSWDDRLMPLHPAIGRDGIWQNFCLDMSWTMILLISSPQVARITEVNHHTQQNMRFLLLDSRKLSLFLHTLSLEWGSLDMGWWTISATVSTCSDTWQIRLAGEWPTGRWVLLLMKQSFKTGPGIPKNVWDILSSFWLYFSCYFSKPKQILYFSLRYQIPKHNIQQPAFSTHFPSPLPVFPLRTSQDISSGSYILKMLHSYPCLLQGYFQPIPWYWKHFSLEKRKKNPIV